MRKVRERECQQENMLRMWRTENELVSSRALTSREETGDPGIKREEIVGGMAK